MASMTRLDRGTRNLAKLRVLADPWAGRGKVTLWNPTADDKHSITVWSMDARTLTLVYDALTSDVNKTAFVLNLATMAGFDKMLRFAWDKVGFRGGRIALR
jgi:hypothetical protein